MPDESEDYVGENIGGVREANGRVGGNIKLIKEGIRHIREIIGFIRGSN